MVREDADPSRAHLAVLLDDRTESYVDPDAFEEAVEVAASLLRSGHTQGHPLRLRTVRGGLDAEVAGPVAGPAAATLNVLAPLADVSLVDGDAGLPGPLSAPGELDVVALITGERADVAELALEAERAEVGAVLVVGAEGAAVPGRAVLLRAPEATALLGAWDRNVSSQAVTS
jgi:hypothetical protein